MTATRATVLAWAVWLSLVAACGKGATSSTGTLSRSTPAASDGGRPVVDGAGAPEEPRAAALWKQATEGDDDDLARLCGYLGADSLVDATRVPARRLLALRALAYADDFTPLPLLATVAASGTDVEAAAALDSVATLAAQPRRATDPEDALEIREGASRLLVLARDATRPAQRRVLAVRALRLLADRGWVSAADVPTDLDAR